MTTVSTGIKITQEWRFTAKPKWTWLDRIVLWLITKLIEPKMLALEQKLIALNHKIIAWDTDGILVEQITTEQRLTSEQK